MSDRSLSLQVNPSDAPLLQALVAQAEHFGKSLAEMFQELKEQDHPLALKVTDEQVVVVLDEVSYVRLVSEARQVEKEKLRQQLLEGVNSEALSMQPADWSAHWDAMRDEIKRRAESQPQC
jgi:hypothetical protein